MTETTLPPTTVVPFRLFTNGLTWAMSLAYTGASSDTSTMSRNRISEAIAARSLDSRRAATAQGLRAAASRAGAVIRAGAACVVTELVTPLLEPELVDEDVPLRVPRVALDVARQEVDLLRVVEVHPRCLGGHLVVDLLPERIGCLRLTHRLRLVDLPLDGLVAVLGDVRRGVAVRVDGPAARHDIQAVGR